MCVCVCQLPPAGVRFHTISSCLRQFSGICEVCVCVCVAGGGGGQRRDLVQQPAAPSSHAGPWAPRPHCPPLRAAPESLGRGGRPPPGSRRRDRRTCAHPQIPTAGPRPAGEGPQGCCAVLSSAAPRPGPHPSPGPGPGWPAAPRFRGQGGARARHGSGTATAALLGHGGAARGLQGVPCGGKVGGAPAECGGLRTCAAAPGRQEVVGGAQGSFWGGDGVGRVWGLGGVGGEAAVPGRRDGLVSDWGTPQKTLEAIGNALWPTWAMQAPPPPPRRCERQKHAWPGRGLNGLATTVWGGDRRLQQPSGVTVGVQGDSS